jgi:hypothetical protein
MKHLIDRLEEAIRYPGFTWDVPAGKAAMQKGYIDLGLGKPSLMRKNRDRVGHKVSDYVAGELISKGKAFIRDPEDTLMMMFDSEAEFVKAVKDDVDGLFLERMSYSDEAEDWKGSKSINDDRMRAKKVKINIKRIKGKMGDGWKVWWNR